MPNPSQENTTQKKTNEKIGIAICLGGFATINQILRFDRLNE